jgi:hypothetical protein
VGQNISGSITQYSSIVEYVSGGTVGTAYTIPVSIPDAQGGVNATVTYTNGTASLQCDTLHSKVYTLSATTTTIDLTSLTDPNGNSINFARVRELLAFNVDTTAGHDVGIYHGASNGWAQLPASANPLYCRYGGGRIRVADPTSTGASNGNVTSGSSRTVTLDPGANTVNLWLVVIGGSAA